MLIPRNQPERTTESHNSEGSGNVTGYRTEDIRNIALVGHGSTGKTTLADLFLARSGAVSRAGSVDDRNSHFDTDDDEKERHSSITSAVGHFDHKGHRVNVIDTPGYPDFIGQVGGALAAVEAAVVVISATAGVEVNTRRVFSMAGQAGIGRMLVISRLDGDNIDFATLLERIRETFGRQCIPVNVPDRTGPGISRVISTLSPDGPGVVDPASFNQPLMDCIVEADESMMERYLAGEVLSPDELAAGVEHAIAEGTLIPIFCVSARKGVGIDELMDGIAVWGPSPLDLPRRDIHGETLPPVADGPLAALVFKTRIDPFLARMNFVRVFSGTLRKDVPVHHDNTKDLKFHAINEVQGHELHAVNELVAGDIGVVVKVDGLYTGDSLGDRSLPALKFPRPMVGWAVEPKTTADQQKISTALHKLCDEDPTFVTTREAQTHEMVVYGMSELHLQVLLDRVQKRDKVGMTHKPPRIPYRETCSGAAEGSYRHKKQSGGAGQFAEVHLRVSHLPQGINPEEYFTKDRFESIREYHYDPVLNSAFVDRVSGGSVPNQFIPAVEKGVKERMEKGAIAGCQVQDVCVELFFGKDHPVDSNENAFRTAGSRGFKEIFAQAKPSLLEPIVHLEITIPAEKLGEITSDLNSRRGRIEGMEQLPGNLQVVKAHAPMAMIQDYSRGLSSMTGGQGSFTCEFSHYEIVPANEQQKIIAAAKHEEEED